MEKNELTVLVTRAETGDNEALNALFNEYYNSVYYFALKMVKDENIAADITQETFVQVITNIKVLRDPLLFGSWLRSITYHQCTRYFRKSKDVLVDEENEEIFEEISEDKAEFIPDEALDKAEFRRTVMTIIDELPEEQRAAVMMYYFDELSVKQIAAIQGISEGTVKSRLNYARKHIKSAVESYEKKNGIRLHGALVPILYWIFSTEISLIPSSTAVGVASGIAAATGVGLQVGAGTQVASAAGMGMQSAAAETVAKKAAQDAARMTAKKASEKAAVEMAKATAKTAAKSAAGKAGAGVAAKAGMAIGAKIAAGVVAAAVTAGAAIGAVAIVKNKEKNKLPEETETVAVTTVKEKNEPSDSMPIEGQIAMYNEYLTNGGYEEIEELSAQYTAGFKISDSSISARLEDVDNDGIYEALIKFTDDLYQHVYAYLDIDDNTVICIKTACYAGGTGGADFLRTATDKETGEKVLMFIDHERSGFAESHLYTYIYSGSEHNLLLSYETTAYVKSYFDDIDDKIDAVMSETDLYALDGDNFTYQMINEEYVSSSEYDTVNQRFEITDEDELSMIPGTYAVPIKAAQSPEGEEPTASLTKEEQIDMYNAYLTGGGYSEVAAMSEPWENYESDLSGFEIESHLIDLDKDGINEVLVNFRNEDYYENFDVFLDIVDGKVICVKSAYHGGGTGGGGYLYIAKDTQSGEDVLIYDEYVSSGVPMRYSNIYVYSGTEHTELVKYSTTRYVGVEELIAEVKSETDLYEIEGDQFFFYKINDEYVSSADVEAMNERFEVDQSIGESMIPGTYDEPIRGEAAGENNTDTETVETVTITEESRAEQVRMYNEYLTGGGYEEIAASINDKYLAEYLTDYFLTDPDIQVDSYLLNIDNDDCYEALVVIHEGPSPNMQAYLDIVDDQVICVASTYFGGVTVDGNRIGTAFDKNTNENVLVVEVEERYGMGEHHGGYKIYDITDHSEIVSCEKTYYLKSYSPDIDAAIEQVMNETDIYELNEAGNGYSDFWCTKINGEYVTSEDYNSLIERFEMTYYNFNINIYGGDTNAYYDGTVDMIRGTMETPIVG